MRTIVLIERRETFETWQVLTAATAGGLTHAYALTG